MELSFCDREDCADKTALNIGNFILRIFRVDVFDVSDRQVFNVTKLDAALVINFYLRKVSSEVGDGVNSEGSHVLEHERISDV